MNNSKVYRKTLPFSFIMFLIDLVGLAFVIGGGTLGFVIGNVTMERALLGLVIGLVVGAIPAALISFFVTNRFKAAQIAMMTRGVVGQEMPSDHIVSAGMAEVKGRFAKIMVFFFVTGAIKAVFRQIGRGVNRLATAVGGNTGNAVSSAIDTGVQVLLGYLCDCCLGWVMFRKDESAAKAACEGAVIFFKHGKALIRNIGRIFGMGIASFILIGGGIFGVSYLIFQAVPQMFVSLSQELIAFFNRMTWDVPEFFSNTTVLSIVVAAIIAIVLWSMIHAVLIRPFILVGVLRNFMEAGKADMPKEEDFAKLDGLSPRFAKLRQEI